MNIWITYGIIAVVLLIAELVYFKIADKCNIIDKPYERSSHSTIVLRGGGVIFAISMLVWFGWQMVHGEWLTAILVHGSRFTVIISEVLYPRERKGRLA